MQIGADPSYVFRHPNPYSWSFEPKINRLQQSVEDYYCAKFQVIPISSFRFIELTYPQTHPHTSWQGDRYISAAVLRRRRR